MPIFGRSGPPPQVMNGPVPSGAWIAVSSSWSQTNGQSRAALQKYPTSREPSQLSAPETSAGGQEGVLGLDDAELVPFRIGEHDVRIVRALTDVEVPGAQLEQPRHRRLLVVERGGRQVEVHAVLAGLALRDSLELDPERGAIRRHQRDLVVGLVNDVPAQRGGPESRQRDRIVGVHAERDEP